MISLRLARELTYQLDKAHEDERLARALAKIPVFLVLYKGEGQSDVLALWQQLSQKGHDPEAYYRVSLDTLRRSTSVFLPEALLVVHRLFNSRGKYSLSVELLSELLAWAEDHEDEKRVADSCQGLGMVFYTLGDYDESIPLLSRALSIAVSIGDDRRRASAMMTIGNVHNTQGRYEEAMEYYERGLRISESLGDKWGMSGAIGNMGSVHNKQCRYAEAMECFERALTMAESLGDKRGMSLALFNVGKVRRNQGRYEEAVTYNTRHLALAETLGDKRSISNATCDIGLVDLELGRYDEAMACFSKYLEMAEALGDKRGVSIANCNMGFVLHELGRYTEAMASHEQYLAMAKTLGDKSGMSVAFGSIGYVHFELGAYEDALRSFRLALKGHEAAGASDYIVEVLYGMGYTLLDLAGGGRAAQQPEEKAAYLKEARENAEECVQLSQEISWSDTLFSGNVLLARIDAAEGNTALATQKLEAMLAEATGEEQIADLHYWLWKIAGAGDGTHHAEALERYTSLYSRIPKFEFRKRIAELRGERVPKSAEEMEP